MTEPEQQPAMEQVSEKCVLLDLSFSLWGLTRKVKRKNVQISTHEGEDVPEQALRLSKRLVKCDEYDRIVSADGETRRRMAEMSLPFRRGLYAVPMKLVPRVIDMLREREAVRDAEIAAFIDAYDAAVDKAREDLGPLFRESDYPTADEVEEAFGLRWNFVELGAAGGLKQISQAMYEREQKKVELEWQDAATTMRDSLRVTFEKLVSELRERLDGERANGKPKIFRDSRVESLRDWMKLFDARNVTGDGALSELVAQADKLLAGVTAQELRDDPKGRASVAETLKAIEVGVAGLKVANAPKRKFNLDDCD